MDNPSDQRPTQPPRRETPDTRVLTEAQLHLVTGGLNPQPLPPHVPDFE